jgi:hypothetical protein
VSNWTHVAAIARIDDIRVFGRLSPDFEEIFGKPLDYDDPLSRWEEAREHPERFLPIGSEGSLNMSVWVNPDRSCADAYTVSIFGDLRDHDNPQEIVDWFVKKVSDDDLMVRNACIVAENELCGSVFWSDTGLGDNPCAEQN